MDTGEKAARIGVTFTVAPPATSTPERVIVAIIDTGEAIAMMYVPRIAQAAVINKQENVTVAKLVIGATFAWRFVQSTVLVAVTR